MCERPPAAASRAAVPLCKGDNKARNINACILPLEKGESRPRSASPIGRSIKKRRQGVARDSSYRLVQVLPNRFQYRLEVIQEFPILEPNDSKLQALQVLCPFGFILIDRYRI